MGDPNSHFCRFLQKKNHLKAKSAIDSDETSILSPLWDVFHVEFPSTSGMNTKKPCPSQTKYPIVFFFLLPPKKSFFETPPFGHQYFNIQLHQQVKVVGYIYNSINHIKSQQSTTHLLNEKNISKLSIKN